MRVASGSRRFAAPIRTGCLRTMRRSRRRIAAAGRAADRSDQRSGMTAGEKSLRTRLLSEGTRMRHEDVGAALDAAISSRSGIELRRRGRRLRPVPTPTAARARAPRECGAQLRRSLRRDHRAATVGARPLSSSARRRGERGGSRAEGRSRRDGSPSSAAMRGTGVFEAQGIQSVNGVGSRSKFRGTRARDPARGVTPIEGSWSGESANNGSPRRRNRARSEATCRYRLFEVAHVLPEVPPCRLRSRAGSRRAPGPGSRLTPGRSRRRRTASLWG